MCVRVPGFWCKYELPPFLPASCSFVVWLYVLSLFLFCLARPINFHLSASSPATGY
eukprot:m.268530 g.268530  ORF g.268530 m.268530 type:complete len:56 (+) comp37198_c0_seq1:60-227(+)